MSDHWTSYWEQGFLTSFCGDYQRNYEDEFRNYWNETFKDFSDSNKILDVATGNLALPLLALESVSDKTEIHACDLAKISKDVISKRNNIKLDDLNRIKLRDGLSIEKLDYESNEFDLVTSMFGFEYADTVIAISKISKILKVGGKFIAISHHENSEIIKKNMQSVECLKELIFKKRLFDHFDVISKILGKVTDIRILNELKYNQKAERSRKKINTILNGLETKFGDAFFETGIVDFVSYFFSQAVIGDINSRKKVINSKLNELKRHITRLNDLIDAAFTENKLESLIAKAEECGLQLETKSEFKKDGTFVALNLIFKKERVA